MLRKIEGQNKRASKDIQPIKSFKSYMLSHEKTDEDTDKTSSIANLKTNEQSYEMLDQQIIYEQDYEKLMSIYERLQIPLMPLEFATQKLANQLTQFTTAELLFKSPAPLWTTHRQSKIVQSYFRTITALDEKSLQLTILSNHQGSYLAVTKKGTKGFIQLFDIHEFPIEMLEKRKKFLAQLRNKYKCQLQNCKLSQLSEQIIYLYHTYKKLNTKIKSSLKQKIDVKHDLKENMEQLLKNLVKSLRQQKISKSKS